MSKYDEDQAKYNLWATYFFILSVGIALGFVSGKNSEEEIRFEMYNALPINCQKIVDDWADMKNEATSGENK